MRKNFDMIQGWVATHEGGYVNHPRDPGGATNKGVTQRVYDGWRRANGLPTQSVRSITEDEAVTLYRTQYWDTVKGDQLPSGLDYAVYDFAVNSGPSRAVKFLQRVIGVAADGQMGNVTLGKIKELEYENEIDDIVEELCTARWNWMKTLSTFKTFGRGWTRRVMGDEIGVQDGDSGVIDRAWKLARGAENIAEPTKPAAGKALEEDTKVTTRIRQGINLDTIGKIAGGGSIPTAIVAASQDEGPMQYALSGAVVIAALLGAVVVYKVLFSKAAAAA